MLHVVAGNTYESKRGAYVEGHVYCALPIRNKQKGVVGHRCGGVQAERWVRGADGAAAESNYGSLSFLAGLRGCIRNIFAKVEFKCLLAAVIGRFEFERGRKSEVVVKAGSQRNPRGYSPFD